MNMFDYSNPAKTPEEYIAALEEPRKSEIQKIHDFILKTVPSLKPVIIAGMLGYGLFHYKSRSGREGEWPKVGLASRKGGISVYLCVLDGKEYIAEKHKEELKPAKVGKSCIVYKKESAIDYNLLGKLLRETEKREFAFDQ
jgi:hypothetical protein